MNKNITHFGMTDPNQGLPPFMLTDQNWRTPIGRVHFLLVTQGCARMEIDGHQHSLDENTFLFLLPNMLIRTLSYSHDLRLHNLFFDFDFITDFPLLLKIEISHKATYAPNFTTDTRTANLLRRYFEFIYERYAVPECNEDIIKGLLFSLILEVNRLYTHKTTSVKISRPDEITDRFFYLLHRHCKKEHNAAFYAGKLCISDKHLMRTIRKKTGQTFHFWLSDFLMREAKLLLKSTDRSIQEIAETLNFPNSSFFARFFRKNEGIAPLQFRKKK